MGEMGPPDATKKANKTEYLLCSDCQSSRCDISGGPCPATRRFGKGEDKGRTSEALSCVRDSDETCETFDPDGSVAALRGENWGRNCTQ
jgi:hypothetical protein